jgi:hypothetical protein
MRAPFAIQAYQSRSLPISAQNCVNWYAEKTPENSKTPIALLGTPGMLPFASLGGTSVRAAHVMVSTLYAVSGTGLYRVTSNGSATLLGTLPEAGEVFMDSNGTDLAILVGATLYVWDEDADTLTQVSDGDFPGASSIAFIDGYLLYTEPDTGGFGWSDLGDFTSWDALSIATAEAAPDNLVRVFVSNRLVLLAGTDTIEIWYNAGTDGVFERVEGGVIEKGLLAAKLITKHDNSAAFVGADGMVYKLDGYRPARISQHGIEKLVGDAIKAGQTTDAYSFNYVQEGHEFAVFTFPSAGFTIAYDAATGLWHERETRDLGYWGPCCYAVCYGKHIVGVSQSGALLSLDLDTFDENGETIIRTATSGVTGDGSVRMPHPLLEMDVETGVGLTTGQGSDPQLMLQYSDDGGRTWSNERWASMGAIGEYRKRVRFHRLGSAYQRVYRITTSDPVKSVIIGAGK